MDSAIRTFGQVRVTVEADPILGTPPSWTNVVEIAEECMDKVVVPRYEAYHDAEKAKAAQPQE